MTRTTIAAVLLILSAVLRLPAADTTFRLSDFVQNPLAVKKVIITPMTAPALNGSTIIGADRINFTTDTNGTFIVTNMAKGDFKVELKGAYADTIFGVEIPDTTNAIDASSNIVTLINQPGAAVAWSTIASDLRYARAGLTNLNGLTNFSQTFATGTSGTDFNIVSSAGVHTFNLPTASGSARGLVSSADWSTFNGKVSTSQLAGQGTAITNYIVSTETTLSNNVLNVGSNIFYLKTNGVGYNGTFNGLTVLQDTFGNGFLTTNRATVSFLDFGGDFPTITVPKTTDNFGTSGGNLGFFIGVYTNYLNLPQFREEAWGTVAFALTNGLAPLSALSSYEPAVAAGTSGQFYSGTKTWLDYSAITNPLDAKLVLTSNALQSEIEVTSNALQVEVDATSNAIPNFHSGQFYTNALGQVSFKPNAVVTNLTITGTNRAALVVTNADGADAIEVFNSSAQLLLSVGPSQIIMEPFAVNAGNGYVDGNFTSGSLSIIGFASTSGNVLYTDSSENVQQSTVTTNELGEVIRYGQDSDTNWVTIYTFISQASDATRLIHIDASASWDNGTNAQSAAFSKIAALKDESASFTQLGSTVNEFTFQDDPSVDLRFQPAGSEAYVQVRGMAAYWVNWTVHVRQVIAQ